MIFVLSKRLAKRYQLRMGLRLFENVKQIILGKDLSWYEINPLEISIEQLSN